MESRDFAKKLKAVIREVPDFPKPGINFYDVTSLMNDGQVFAEITECLCNRYASQKLDAIVGIDARGFIFGAALAYSLGIGFIPVRKAGKLPPEVERESYTLEYGEGVLEVHRHAIKQGQRLVLIDDLLATGGTARAALDLLKRLGAKVLESAFVVELEFLNGRKKLSPVPVHSLVSYSE